MHSVMAIRSRHGRRHSSIPAPIPTQVYRSFIAARSISDVPCPALRPANHNAIPSCTTLVNHVFYTGADCENAACVMLADLAFHGMDPTIPYDPQPEITISPLPILEARLANFYACIADLGRVAVAQHKMVWDAVSSLNIPEQNRLLQLFPAVPYGAYTPMASQLNDVGACVLLARIVSAISMRTLCERDIRFLSAVLAGEIADLVAQAHMLREHLAKLRLLERELYRYDMLEYDLGVKEKLEPDMVAVYEHNHHYARVEYAREFFASGTGVDPINDYRYDVFDELSGRVIAANEWFEDQKARFRQEISEDDEAVELPAWWINMQTEPLRERISFKPWGHHVGVESQFGPIEEDDAEARVDDKGIEYLLPTFTYNDDDEDDEDDEDKEAAPSSEYSRRASSIWERQGIFVSPHSPLTPDTRAPGDVTYEYSYSPPVSSVWEKQGIFVSPHSPLTPDTRAPGAVTYDYSSLALQTPCLTTSSVDIKATTGADDVHHLIRALTLFNEGQNKSDSDFSYSHTRGAAYAGIPSPLLVTIQPPTPDEFAGLGGSVKDGTSVEWINPSTIDLLRIQFALDISPAAANIPLPPSPPEAQAVAGITEWIAGMTMPDAAFAFTFTSVPLPGLPVEPSPVEPSPVLQTKQPPWSYTGHMRLTSFESEDAEAAFEKAFYKELEYLDLHGGWHEQGKRKAADFDGGMTSTGAAMKKAKTW